MAESTRLLVRKALHWIGVGQSIPLKAFCEAVSIPDDSDTLDKDDLVDEREISRRCSSLIRKTLHGSAFEFAHFTVEEYLRTIDPSSTVGMFRYSEEEAFRTLARTALRFLTFPEFERRPLATRTEVEYMRERNRRHPFYSHAASLLISQKVTTLDLLRDLSVAESVNKLFDLERSGYFLSWVIEGLRFPISRDGYEERLIPLAVAVLKSELTPLHAAAALSQPALCNYLLELHWIPFALCACRTCDFHFPEAPAVV
jgi:hypothetical protein